jgi:PKD repeat protein
MAGETYTCTITSASNIVQIFTINQDGVSAFITLTPDQANVPATAGSLQFTVNCPEDLTWDITGLATWLSASPLSGTGPGTVTLSYETNTSSDSRSDEFSVSGSGASDVFSITQVGAGSPTANFSANPTWGTASLTSQFTDESTAGTNPIISWSWNFGDGGTSSNQNPSHSYSSPGSYTVSLTISDGELSDTKTIPDYIQVYEVLTVNAGDDQALEVGQTSQLNGSFSGGSGNVEISWEGVGNTIPISNPNLLNPNVGPFLDVAAYYFRLNVEDLITGETQNDEMMVDVLLGLEEDLSSKIAVYPNPTNGKLWIKTEEPIESIKINDAMGSEIVQVKTAEKSTVINLGSHPNGVYLVQVLTKDGLRTFKVVKK